MNPPVIVAVNIRSVIIEIITVFIKDAVFLCVYNLAMNLALNIKFKKEVYKTYLFSLLIQAITFAVFMGGAIALKYVYL